MILKPHARVVCNGCAALGMLDGRYEVVGLTRASQPEFAPLPDGQNLLVCPAWPPPNPVDGMQARTCEDCGMVVAVSPSSLWLL